MKDLTGIQIGRLTVLEYAGRNKKNEPMWLCQCSCGNKKEIKGYSLTCKKPTQSCGCIQHEILVKRNKENGIRNGDTENPLYGRIYRIWCAMKHRCEKENDVNYHLYGGRGITVCKEWHDWETFKNWALNNGYQDDLSIDRIDTDGNYIKNTLDNYGISLEDFERYNKLNKLTMIYHINKIADDNEDEQPLYLM